MSIELSEQEQLRRQSLAALRELGIDPYPAARYEVTATAREIAENFDPAKNNFQGIRIAGRIMSRRIMGSASLLRTAGPHGPHPGLYPARRHLSRRRSDALQHGVQEAARHRRHRRSRGFRIPHQHRRTVGTLPEADPALQIAAAPARREREGRTDLRRLHRPRNPLPPALRRSDRESPTYARFSSSVRRSSPRCANISTSSGTSKSKPRFCSLFRAVRRHVRSLPTTTRSTSTNTCASPASCTSRS